MELKELETKNDFLELIKELKELRPSEESKNSKFCYSINFKEDAVPLKFNHPKLERILKENCRGKNIDSISLTTSNNGLVIIFPQCKYQIEEGKLYFKHPYLREPFKFNLK